MAAEPTDRKRLVVVDKFFTSILPGFQESPKEEIALSNESAVRDFCLQLESEIWDMFLEKPREYKSKVFTLNFNLSDRRNTSVRRRILTGEFSPHQLANASSETLASDDLKAQREERREKYYSTQVMKTGGSEDESLPEHKQASLPQVTKRQKTTAEETLPMDALAATEIAMPSFDLPPVTTPRVQKENVDFSMDMEIDASDDSNVESHLHEQVSPPQASPVSDVGHTDDTNAAAARSNAQVELRNYASTLKQKILLLKHEPLRIGHSRFVDYLSKHIGV